MQRLENDTENKDSLQSSVTASPVATSRRGGRHGSGSVHQHHRLETPIAMMNYHLDDMEIPLREDADPFAIPPREIADEYFDAYMTFVLPLFGAVRRAAFTAQYRLFFERPSKPPRKWLAVLNMIFAIGCRYSRLTGSSRDNSGEDDLLFLTRARLLSLCEKTLFEHTDLQQIQLEHLVAVYLLCLGQVNRYVLLLHHTMSLLTLNRASKFSSMALRSALSLGINLRLTDDRTQDASKEARCRLWWSIYSLEHLLTSMHGRASCVGESLCSVPPPIPIEEDFFDQPEAQRLLSDRVFREAQLRLTLFEADTTTQNGAVWATACEPCPSLFFYFLIDLSLISQAVLNKVYSIEGVRQGSSQTEYRLQKYSLRMDRWLSKLPPSYQFTIPAAGPWHLNHAQLDNESAPFTRERVCLAMSYYSARITLCRPCLPQHPPHPTGPTTSQEMNPRTKLRLDMATHCLQAACSLISILPDKPDVTWLAHFTPWWSVLHFLMQATTALLLSLSHCSLLSPSNTSSHPSTASAPTHAHAHYLPLLETDLTAVIAQTKKALWWIHAMASVDPAARRAFVLCDGATRKIAPALRVDLKDWPSVEDFAGGGEEVETGSRMDGLEDLVDFGGSGPY